jgi:glycosyltransferase involved in cell wall biosynthesis
MRIGLDILCEVAGRSSGTQTYLEGFLNALAKANDGKHEFFLFVNSSNERHYRIDDAHFRQVPFPFSSRTRPLRVLTQLLLIPYHARRLNLDILNFLGTTGAFLVGCATVQHVKTLHHLQMPGILDWRSEVFRRLMVGPAARCADIVIANSESQRTDVLNLLKVSPDRVVVVPEAVDHDLFVPKGSGDSYQGTLAQYGVTHPYILFVSSLWAHKNAHGLIEAYALLRSRARFPHKLVIVGGLPARGYHDKLRRLVAAHRLEDHVQFVGHVSDRRQIRDFYVGAAVFVYASFMETFGLTLLESMACGTPVVTSNRASMPEVAGDAALIVDPDRPEQIADAIWTLIDDRSTHESCTAKGLQRAREFTWERTARETLAAYELAYGLRRGGQGAGFSPMI